jgi:hypothetical protein
MSVLGVNGLIGLDGHRTGPLKDGPVPGLNAQNDEAVVAPSQLPTRGQTWKSRSQREFEKSCSDFSNLR